jgi:3-deoxy-D-manno-octulosonic-acid transferase
MWKVAYNVAANILFPFFFLYSLTQKKIRKNLFERSFTTTRGSPPLRDAVWIHAASIGEAVIAETLVNYMERTTNIPGFMVTTNTYYAKNLLLSRMHGKARIFSLPFDLTWVIRRFYADSLFKALIIVETEIWPNLIWEAQRRNIPVIIINGRISDRTIRNYLRLSFFVKEVLRGVDLVLTQSEEHTRRYISIGMDPHKVVTTGNIKYFRDLGSPSTEKSKEKIVAFGSVKEKELTAVFNVIRALRKAFPSVIVYVAPRELHLIATIERELSSDMKVRRYSAFPGSTGEPPELVIVDTVGDLLSIYEKSALAFVGGSLAPYGGQNILEPLFFGTPVIFGPHIENFGQIGEIILRGNAGLMVHSEEELFGTMKDLLSNETARSEMGKRGLQIIADQRQVMERTVRTILERLDKRARTRETGEIASRR